MSARDKLDKLKMQAGGKFLSPDEKRLQTMRNPPQATSMMTSLKNVAAFGVPSINSDKNNVKDSKRDGSQQVSGDTG